jgi:cell division protein FtsB
VTESGRRVRPRDTQSRDTQSRDIRPRFTGRAAILAVFFCAVVLSLAYPVREYLAERKQIDELEVQRAQIARQLSRLEAERQHLRDPAYIEQLARDRLHMCLPNQMCYVVIDPAVRSRTTAAPKHAAEPWYAKLWSSVQLADGQPSPRPHAATRRG